MKDLELFENMLSLSVLSAETKVCSGLKFKVQVNRTHFFSGFILFLRINV